LLHGMLKSATQYLHAPEVELTTLGWSDVPSLLSKVSASHFFKHKQLREGCPQL